MPDFCGLTNATVTQRFWPCLTPQPKFRRPKKLFLRAFCHGKLLHTKDQQIASLKYMKRAATFLEKHASKIVLEENAER